MKAADSAFPGPAAVRFPLFSVAHSTPENGGHDHPLQNPFVFRRFSGGGGPAGCRVPLPDRASRSGVGLFRHRRVDHFDAGAGFPRHPGGSMSLAGHLRRLIESLWDRPQRGEPDADEEASGGSVMLGCCKPLAVEPGGPCRRPIRFDPPTPLQARNPPEGKTPLSYQWLVAYRCPEHPRFPLHIGLRFDGVVQCEVEELGSGEPGWLARVTDCESCGAELARHEHRSYLEEYGFSHQFVCHACDAFDLVSEDG
jgi:hypothetical protein